MTSPEGGRSRREGRFYYPNEGVERGPFPFERVMTTYYAQAKKRAKDDISAATVLDRAMAAELGPESYSLWWRDGSLDDIKKQIMRGLFDLNGLMDFQRPFMFQEAENSFRFKARVVGADLFAKAKQAIVSELYETEKPLDEMDIEGAASYLVSGLVEERTASAGEI